jgi:hypothetical protein
MKIVNDGVSSAWNGQHVANSCPLRVSLQPYCAAAEDRDISRRSRSTSLETPVLDDGAYSNILSI